MTCHSHNLEAKKLVSNVVTAQPPANVYLMVQKAPTNILPWVHKLKTTDS
jgi:hypothetical protein